MTTVSEILEELRNESRQIVKFIDTHSFGHSVSTSNFRDPYATAHFYVSIDWHTAVVNLTDEEMRGSALTLIRPMLETWIRGTWIMLVPSADEIERIKKKNRILEKKKLSHLEEEVKEKDEAFGKIIENVLKNVYSFLSCCIHGYSSYLNLYFDKETQSIQPNVPDNIMIHMLDAANTIALSSALNMRAIRMAVEHKKTLHELDEHLLSPFTEKLDEYLVYSTDLLKPISS